MSDITMPEELSAFIDKLVEEKNVGKIDPTLMDTMKADLFERLQETINLAFLESMPDESLEEFDKILDTDDEAVIQKFLQEHVKNMDQVIANALVNFRQAYLGN